MTQRFQVVLKSDHDLKKMMRELRFVLREDTMGNVVSRLIVDAYNKSQKEKTASKDNNTANILGVSFVKTNSIDEGFMTTKEVVEAVEATKGRKLSNNAVAILLENEGAKRIRNPKADKLGWLLISNN